MLSKLSVRNYKSLEDFEIEFSNFNVMIGPNNSGKSNIFDCLKFLSEIIQKGILSESIRPRGGYDHIVFSGDENMAIGIRVEMEEMKYEIEIWKYDVLSEKLIKKNSEDFVLLDRSSDGKALVWDEKDKERRDYSHSKAELAISSFGDLERNPMILKFKEYIEKWRLYDPIPHRMREFRRPRRDFDLDKFGENIQQVLNAMYLEHPRLFGELQETLTGAIGDVEGLTAPLSDSDATYIAIKEKYFDKRFDSFQVSDGTLRLLGYLGVLFSPEPPTLALFEEPENHIHPRLLGLLVELFKKASEDTQIFIATHSPYLLNQVELDDLIIVEKREGGTIWNKVESKKELKKEMDLLGISIGELWWSGELGGVP